MYLIPSSYPGWICGFLFNETGGTIYVVVKGTPSFGGATAGNQTRIRTSSHPPAERTYLLTY